MTLDEDYPDFRSQQVKCLRSPDLLRLDLRLALGVKEDRMTT